MSLFAAGAPFGEVAASLFVTVTGAVLGEVKMMLDCYCSWQVQNLGKLQRHFSWRGFFASCSDVGMVRFMADALFGEVAPPLFVARAIFGQIWNDTQSPLRCIFQYKMPLQSRRAPD